MELLASIFVGKPQNILIISVILFSLYLILQFIVKRTSLHPRPLLILSIFWGVYAVWEMLVQMQTPEANIRVDILIIWSILAIVSAWKLYKVFR